MEQIIILKGNREKKIPAEQLEQYQAQGWKQWKAPAPVTPPIESEKQEGTPEATEPPAEPKEQEEAPEPAKPPAKPKKQKK